MRPISTIAVPLTRLFASNQTGSITAPVETTAEPTGDGIMGTLRSGETFNQIFLQFFGTGEEGSTAVARITGWNSVLENGVRYWVPVPLYTVTLTLGTATRVSAERWVDTIVAATEYTEAKEILSGADNLQAGIKLDVFGCEKVQVQLGKTTCTSINALGKGF